MPDGSKTPIERIAVNDQVQSYDPVTGELKPGRVSRVMTQTATYILDVHGMMITPGHVTLCGKVEGEKNRFAGRHIPILDILRLDGVLVRQDGSLVRAATGCDVGSEGDRMIWAVPGPANDQGGVDATGVGRIRLGTRHVLPDGCEVSVHRQIIEQGLTVTEEGLLVRSPGDHPMPYHWTFTEDLPQPEDYVLGRSCVTLAAIYAANEWEGTGPVLAAPAGSIHSDAGPSSSDAQAMPTAAEAVPNVPWRLKGCTTVMADGTLTVDPNATPPAELPSVHASGPVDTPALSLDRTRPEAPVSRKARRAAKAKARKQGRTLATVH